MQAFAQQMFSLKSNPEQHVEINMIPMVREKFRQTLATCFNLPNAPKPNFIPAADQYKQLWDRSREVESLIKQDRVSKRKVEGVTEDELLKKLHRYESYASGGKSASKLPKEPVASSPLSLKASGGGRPLLPNPVVSSFTSQTGQEGNLPGIPPA